LIGTNREAKAVIQRLSSKSAEYIGPVLDRNKKMSMIKSWDLYFYETTGNEGASIAVLEGLACGIPVVCKPIGGNLELIQNNINGYIVRDREGFLMVMKSLANDHDHLVKVKEQVRKDFDERLHIRHTACKYMQLFEQLLKEM